MPNPPFTDLFDFVRRVRPNRDELEKLILAGALDCLHSNRRAMLWAIPQALAACENELDIQLEIDDSIEDFNPVEKAVRERLVLGMDVHQHLMAFERERVRSRGGLTTNEVRYAKPGRKLIVVGNPTRLRFPPTPSGKRVVFFDLEDETGLLNVTCFDAVYQRDGHAIVCSPYVTIIGVTQSRDGFTAFLAKRVFAYEPRATWEALGHESLPVGVADFLVG